MTRASTSTEIAVAKALAGDDCDLVATYDGKPLAQDGHELTWWQVHLDDARKAIRAMREPPYESWDALAATGKMWRELDSTTVWRVFIDAASPPDP